MWQTDGWTDRRTCLSVYVTYMLLCVQICSVTKVNPFFSGTPCICYASLFFTLPVCILMPLFVMEGPLTEDYGKKLVFRAVFMVLSTVYLIHVHHLHLTKTDGCSFSPNMFTWWSATTCSTRNVFRWPSWFWNDDDDYTTVLLTVR